jgi:flagellar assembly protein FliH
MARLPNLNVRPIVVPDESMHDGDCIIETEMGSVDLGVAAQVHRMEAALFDTPPVKEQETTSTFDTDRLAVQL